MACRFQRPSRRVASSAPRGAPSSRNCTPATATLSDAVADTVTVPETVLPVAGAVTATVGAVVSAIVKLAALVPVTAAFPAQVTRARAAVKPTQVTARAAVVALVATPGLRPDHVSPVAAEVDDDLRARAQVVVEGDRLRAPDRPADRSVGGSQRERRPSPRPVFGGGSGGSTLPSGITNRLSDPSLGRGRPRGRPRAARRSGQAGAPGDGGVARPPVGREGHVDRSDTHVVRGRPPDQVGTPRVQALAAHGLHQDDPRGVGGRPSSPLQSSPVPGRVLRRHS